MTKHVCIFPVKYSIQNKNTLRNLKMNDDELDISTIWLYIITIAIISMIVIQPYIQNAKDITDVFVPDTGFIITPVEPTTIIVNGVPIHNTTDYGFRVQTSIPLYPGTTLSGDNLQMYLDKHKINYTIIKLQ